MVISNPALVTGKPSSLGRHYLAPATVSSTLTITSPLQPSGSAWRSTTCPPCTAKTESKKSSPLSFPAQVFGQLDLGDTTTMPRKKPRVSGSPLNQKTSTRILLQIVLHNRNKQAQCTSAGDCPSLKCDCCMDVFSHQPSVISCLTLIWAMPLEAMLVSPTSSGSMPTRPRGA